MTSHRTKDRRKPLGIRIFECVSGSVAAMIVKRQNTGFEEFSLALIYEDVVAFHFKRRVRPYGSTNPDAIHSHEIGEFLQLAENVSNANGAVVRRTLSIPFAEKLSDAQ